MPEGHTIHALAQRLGVFVGTPVACRSPQGAFAPGAAFLDGRRIDGVEAVGKNLLVDFGGPVLHVHLGISGSARVRAIGVDLGRGRPRLECVNPTHWARVWNPKLCQVLRPEGVRALKARLGPDPLRADADPDAFIASALRSDEPIGVVLLDQSVLAGVGNVYRAEVLFRAGIDPFARASGLGAGHLRRLWDDLVAIMPVGVAANQIVSAPKDLALVRRRLAAGLEPGPLRAAHLAYERTGWPCGRCGALVRSRELGGRTLYWCPGCQVERGR